MQILFNSGHHIDGHARMADWTRDVVTRTLERFDQHVTRVEVHVSDVNAGKEGGDDKRCLMEARIEGRPPIAVSHLAGRVEAAIDGAAQKLKRSLTTTLDKHRKR